MEDKFERLQRAFDEEQRLRVEEQRLRVEAQRLLAEEQRLLAEEQRQREEEQRQREEEQRVREEERLQEQRRREEEQRQREEEQRVREEERLQEQRRREEEQRVRAEEQRQLADFKRQLQPQTLAPFLESWHTLNLAITVETEHTLTTQGCVTNPVGRVYPRRIVPWDDFPARQGKVWELLSEPSFASEPLFPCPRDVEFLRSQIRPISCEMGLRTFENNTAEAAVKMLSKAVYENQVLRDRLGLRGSVTFESHTNLGNVDKTLSGPLGQMSRADESPGAQTLAPTTPASRAYPTVQRTRNGQADQFCVYRTSDNINIPVCSIEYKPPHKLTQKELIHGLVSEIQPERDVINKEGKGLAHTSKVLSAAVITQLFSYMVSKGIQYGYVCTGEALVFLHIPTDPSIVYYHVCIPNLDVVNEDENRLHYTAAAQIFAFTLQALRAEPPPSSWHDAAARLDKWAVEYDDILSKIPATNRKEKSGSPYKGPHWRGFQRSPIQTRRSCKQSDPKPWPRDDGDDTGDGPPSPTPDPSTRSGRKATSSRGSSSNRQLGGGRRRSGKGVQEGIENGPYCTHSCLLGLAFGRPIDKTCPNAGSHGPTHLPRNEFLRLLRAQLAADRGPDADAIPLFLAGSVGSMFKVRLSAFGYTLVAKGVEAADLGRLKHENDVYCQLGAIQGRHVPVCLGLLDLILPHYCDGGVYEHFLLLSWAGRPLSWCMDQVDKTFAIAEITAAFAALHRLRVLHGDAEPRNIMYDGQGLMVIDFERSELCSRQRLRAVTANTRVLKRKHETVQKRGMDPLAREMRCVVHSMSRWFGTGEPIAYKPQKWIAGPKWRALGEALAPGSGVPSV